MRVALLYPELLGTYGDRGNARILVQRLAWRGVPAELVEAPWGEPVPGSCDIYVVGGGEDSPQASAASALIAGGVLARAVEGGAAVLGICAGFQILGRSFFGPDGAPREGLGLLDCVTARRASPRVVGEILVRPNPGAFGGHRRVEPGGGGTAGQNLPLLSGYENHAGLTDVGPGAAPLGRVDVGVGNGDGTEGAIGERIVGTYLHGPVLARNPALADLILSWFVDDLEPLDDSEIADLREERRRSLASEAGRRRRGGSPLGWWPYRRRRAASIEAPRAANFSV